jgi:adenylate kinase family enzyme
MSKRIVRVVRRKAPVVDRGPKDPTKQKVIVLRRVREDEEYVRKEEIPVSIGIPEYYKELRELDLARKREAERFARKTIIFLIGGPGSGKGTQSARIIEKFDTGYMSTGDLLRAEAASGSELGVFISEQMKLGAIVPQGITISLLKKEILRQDKQLFLIDGFPRKVDQAVTFEETVCKAECALWLDVPDEVLVERLLERSKVSGRADDNPETIKLKIKTFHEVSEPVFALFEQTGRAVRIDGNREPDVVFADVEALINRVLNGEPLFPVVVEEEEQSESGSASVSE